RSVEADRAAGDVETLAVGLEGPVAHPHRALDARRAGQFAAHADQALQARVDAAADDADLPAQVDLDVGPHLHAAGVDPPAFTIAAFVPRAPRGADDADVAGQFRHPGAAQLDQALVRGHLAGERHPAAVARKPGASGDDEALARVQRRAKSPRLDVELAAQGHRRAAARLAGIALRVRQDLGAPGHGDVPFAARDPEALDHQPVAVEGGTQLTPVEPPALRALLDRQPVTGQAAVELRRIERAADVGGDPQPALDRPVLAEVAAQENQRGQAQVDASVEPAAVDAQPRPAALADPQPLVLAAGDDLAHREPDLPGHGLRRAPAVEPPLPVHPQAGEGGIDVPARARPAAKAVQPGQRPGERQAGHRALGREPRRLARAPVEPLDRRRSTPAIGSLEA